MCQGQRRLFSRTDIEQPVWRWDIARFHNVLFILLIGLISELIAMTCIAQVGAPGRDLITPDSLPTPAPTAASPLEEQPAANGVAIGAYKASYALLIGVSEYHHPQWPDLLAVTLELDSLEPVLRQHGFHIQRVNNPTGAQLRQAFQDFINEHGWDSENRLLFFFSGHGYTRQQGLRGYLVPADAPDPREDEKGFLSRALDMNQIMAWARQLEARHALFLFDSCFSGTVFQARSLPATPPHISALVQQPVRQFITAGSAGETVPAQSVFTPLVRDGLGQGLADLDRDGFITGTELGIFLQARVPRHTQQTPQFGKISDYELARGDMVFVAQPPTRGQLRITSIPDGATVFVNGRQQGRTPLTLLDVLPGSSTIRLSQEGFKAIEQSVVIQAHQETALHLTLEPVTQHGSLTLTSEPAGATWSLDGQVKGVTPDHFSTLAVGRYRLDITLDNYQPWSQIIEITPNNQVRVQAQLLPSVVWGQVIQDPLAQGGVGPELIAIPAGVFDLGASAQFSEVRTVTIPKPLAVGRYEVTFEQYDRFAQSTGRPLPPDDGWGRGRQPVVYVNWQEAMDYAAWLSQQTQKSYRLLTEAEWEYAARGGRQQLYSWGNRWIPDQANCSGCSPRWGSLQPAYVGSFPANAFGLYDMAGNVAEWTCSMADERYRGQEQQCASSERSVLWRVVRGGSWKSPPDRIRTVYRSWTQWHERANDLGFRVVRDIP